VLLYCISGYSINTAASALPTLPAPPLSKRRYTLEVLAPSSSTGNSVFISFYAMLKKCSANIAGTTAAFSEVLA
jgi:hypothetical protein